MDVKDYIKYLLPEEIYSIVTIIYLINLDKLNKQLLFIKFESSLDLLAYDNSKPVWFFVVAFILFLVGAIRVYCKIISIYRDGLCIGEFISSLVSIVLIIIFLILLFTFIDNPILRAIFVVVGGGIAAIFAFTK